MENEVKYITIAGETIPELGSNLAEVKMDIDNSLTIDEMKELIIYLQKKIEESERNLIEE